MHVTLGQKFCSSEHSDLSCSQRAVGVPSSSTPVEWNAFQLTLDGIILEPPHAHVYKQLSRLIFLKCSNSFRTQRISMEHWLL